MKDKKQTENQFLFNLKNKLYTLEDSSVICGAALMAIVYAFWGKNTIFQQFEYALISMLIIVVLYGIILLFGAFKSRQQAKKNNDNRIPQIISIIAYIVVICFTVWKML